LYLKQSSSLAIIKKKGRERERMGIASKAGDWTFKAFTAGLGVTTIYLAATFSVNVYRGLSWHNAQSVTNSSMALTTFHSFITIRDPYILVSF
jgi:hypothetical protein